MKKFMAVFLGSKESMKKWEVLDESARKEREMKGMKAWGNWVEVNKKSIAVMGSPLGKTKRIDPKGISDTRNELTAFTVVEAESHEAAAKLFLDHPHFAIFPGDCIELMECLPIPGM
jgi:hypothetical protein